MQYMARQLPRNIHSQEHGAGRAPPWWMLTPAYSVLPFIRSPLGYNIVKPLYTLIPDLGIVFFSYVLVLFLPAAGPGFLWLPAFVAASFCLSCLIFAKRMKGQGGAEQIHTAEAGYSVLTWRSNLPPLLCEMVIIPVALALVGWIVAHTFSFELGWWLILSAASYMLMARWEDASRRARIRTVGDDMIRAQTFEETLETRERRARKPSGAGAQPQPGYGQGYDSGPDEAELGRYTRPKGQPQAGGPDMAVWSRNGDSIMPAFMGWFRRRRGKGGPPAL